MLARYRLRGSEVAIHLRHGTVDLDTFDEIFRRGHYNLPTPAAVSLAGAQPPLKVIDLGANIGLFAARIRGLYPDAQITAVEPHPANVEVLSKTIAANGRGLGWELIEACAGVRSGVVPFSLAEFATSRVEPGQSAITVPAIDVLPLIEGADLVKIDIEGGEWPILADPRLAYAPPTVIALEYHAHGCPTSDPVAHPRELLGRAGYRTADGEFDLPPGQGMLWAWRSDEAPVHTRAG